MLTGISWIFLALGVVSLALFLRDPDIHAHPQLALLAGTALFGVVSLRVLAYLLREPPHADS